jgi:hypothetical protein
METIIDVKQKAVTNILFVRGVSVELMVKKMFVLSLDVIIIQRHMDIVYVIETNKCVLYQHVILLLFPKEYATDIMLLLFVNMKDALVEL